MNVKNKVLSADEIRAELARRKISKVQLSRDTGIYYQYLVELLQGYRPATRMREKITKYLQDRP
ncbi:MAG: hypothetical protein WC176_08870 [Candidatus Cloacimonadaceae bacterium]|jgi:hypothetical protein